MAKRNKAPHPLLLLIAGWMVPGLAHALLGKRAKALLFLLLIVGTFVAGMVLSGFDNVYYQTGRWTTLTQVPAGLVAALGMKLHDPSVTPVQEEESLFKVGTLYTSVAGLLNVLVIMDAVHVAWLCRRGENR